MNWPLTAAFSDFILPSFCIGRTGRTTENNKRHSASQTCHMLASAYMWPGLQPSEGDLIKTEDWMWDKWRRVTHSTSWTTHVIHFIGCHLQTDGMHTHTQTPLALSSHYECNNLPHHSSSTLACSCSIEANTASLSDLQRHQKLLISHSPSIPHLTTPTDCTYVSQP